MHFARPRPEPAVLADTLALMGWQDVILDQREEPYEDEENPHGSRVRFSGTLARSILPLETETVRWAKVTRVGLDLRADLAQNVTTFQLETGKSYELRFSSRLRQSSREACVAALVRIGFGAPDILFALKKNMRLPDSPGASWTLWYAQAEWKGPMSFTNSADPLFFEDCRESEG